MASVQHTVTGPNGPDSSPPSIGAHYINTTTGQQWLASGTDLVADWGLPLPSAARISGTDVSEFTLPTDGTVSIWRVSGATDRVLIFPALQTPGLYVVDLVVENVQGAALPLIVAHPDGGTLVNFGDQVVGANDSAYFRFHCSVNASGYPNWILVETHSLSLALEKVTEVGGSTISFEFDGAQPLTFWTIPDTVPRTISFAMLKTSYAAPRDLVIKNDSSSAAAVTVSSSGRPLKDNASLNVPANSAVLFRLAYYNGSGAWRWSLISSTVL